MIATDGAAAFVRRYAKTGGHAVETAAMTSFGALTVFDTDPNAHALKLYPCEIRALYSADRF